MLSFHTFKGGGGVKLRIVIESELLSNSESVSLVVVDIRISIVGDGGSLSNRLGKVTGERVNGVGDESVGGTYYRDFAQNFGHSGNDGFSIETGACACLSFRIGGIHVGCESGDTRINERSENINRNGRCLAGRGGDQRVEFVNVEVADDG